MATALYRRPALDVGVHLLRDRARRPDDLRREGAVAGWHIDRAPAGDRPLSMHPGVVGPERRPDRAGEPVERYIRQQTVAADGRIGIAAAIGPAAELLGDPGRESGRRIRQT